MRMNFSRRSDWYWSRRAYCYGSQRAGSEQRHEIAAMAGSFAADPRRRAFRADNVSACQSGAGGSSYPAGVERNGSNGKGNRTVVVGGYASDSKAADSANRVRRICAGRRVATCAGLRTCKAIEQRAVRRNRKSRDRGAPNQLVPATRKSASRRSLFRRVVRRVEARIAYERVRSRRDSRGKAGRYRIAGTNGERCANTHYVLSVREESEIAVAIHCAGNARGGDFRGGDQRSNPLSWAPTIAATA